ncbi:MAG: FG-GAP-like repeat-containing protein [Bacteroidales bacterium]|nr:FG-GAP-like repeat-containing protein [Bacteroidales bacterium]
MLKHLFIALVAMVVLAYSAAGQVSPGRAENYSMPFAGGMNACQFGEIDIDRDGIMDLIAFDRYGNRLMPFLNGGTAGRIDYTWAPEYVDKFPLMYHWVIAADYNMDGKNDLFTYNPQFPGMVVYKNTSTDELRFERVIYPYLTSWYGSGYVNILVTYADYPGISDLDGDGDLDILTFWALGSFVEMHQNMSMEEYGHADSLIFERTTWCWGEFAESEESNILYLDTCFRNKQEALCAASGRDRHTGSTLLLYDLNNNGNKDLLLGDVDYPQVKFLANEGSPQEAYISYFSDYFPNDQNPSWIYSMPVTALIDVNNDGMLDYLASPFDPNPFVTQNFNSVWLYLNQGTKDLPQWNLSTKSFLQQDMIDVGSGAYPVFADINLDGLQDLIIGNWGYYQSSWYDAGMTLHSEYAGRIALFMNTGTADEAYFEFVTDDFGNIRGMDILGPAPAFGDIDADGDPDMIVGRDDGTLLFYRNCSCLGNPEDFVLEQENYQNIDVGQYSTPFIFDLDEDGLPDLIIGKKSGTLSFYKNTGTAYDPVFTLITDSLGKVNVTDPGLSYDGYSTPWFFRHADGSLGLISGSEQGTIFYFRDIEGNLQGTFTQSYELWKEIDSVEFNIMRGYRTTAAIASLNNDAYAELAVGNFSGGLNLYSNGIEPEVSMDVDEIYAISSPLQFNLYPNPARQIVNIQYTGIDKQSAFMLRIIDFSGKLKLERNISAGDKEIIHVNGWPAGIYLCLVFDLDHPETRATEKLVIVR